MAGADFDLSVVAGIGGLSAHDEGFAKAGVSCAGPTRAYCLARDVIMRTFVVNRRVGLRESKSYVIKGVLG